MFQSLKLNNFEIQCSQQYFKIISHQTEVALQAQLLIDKQANTIAELDLLNPHALIDYEMVTASAILGIFEGKLQNYLVICDKCELVAQIQNLRYQRIQSVHFIPYKHKLDRKKNHDEYKTISNLRQYLSESFYYCLSQEGAQTLQNFYAKAPLDISFLWNFQLTTQFQATSTLKWCAVMLQGYIYQIVSKMERQFKYVLISRRSHFQGGTRFHHRGIDDSGNVANYVETEFIVVVDNMLIGHTIYRGSVPTFWSQKNVARSPKLTRTLELSNPSFIRHFNKLLKYGMVYCINLMSEAKAEKKLNDAFEKLIEMNQIQEIKYQRIDFHKEVKDKKFNQIDKFIYQLDDCIKSSKYFMYDTKSQKIVQIQSGVFRINCLDCLDRTNIFQSRISLRILELLFRQLNVNDMKTEFLMTLDAAKGNDFLNLYKYAWSHNGDNISQIYCGTDATTSEMTKQGKDTWKGKLLHKFASLERITNQIFVDEKKNEIIQSLLTKQSIHSSPLDIFLSTSVAKYCTMKKIKVFASTWNLGSRSIDQKLELNLDLLKFTEAPEILVLGFQEIVKLNAKSMVISNQDNIYKINLILDQQLGHKYIRLESENLMGLYLVVYIQKELVPSVSNIQKSNLKTGFQGHVGNKGACAIQLTLHDTKISICNCHLKSGQGNLQRRIQELIEIHDKIFIKNSKTESLLNSDYTILLGDLNFRLEQSHEDILRIINNYQTYQAIQKHTQASQELSKLHQFDQGNFAKLTTPLDQYLEPAITFLPTYKYDINANRYDTSKKQRIPSYCDRILIKVKEPLSVKQLHYNRVERIESDHRPVVSIFQIESKIVDKSKQNKLIQEFMTLSKQIEQQEEQVEEQLEQEDQIEEYDNVVVVGDLTQSQQSKAQISMTESYMITPEEKQVEPQRGFLGLFK